MRKIVATALSFSLCFFSCLTLPVVVKADMACTYVSTIAQLNNLPLCDVTTKALNVNIVGGAGSGNAGAIGAAGVNGATAQTIQGITGGVPVPVSGSLTATTTFPYSGTTSSQTATTASMIGTGGIYNTSPPTITNTQFSPFQVDSNGNLKVNVITGAGTPFPYSGTAGGQTAASASFLGSGGIYNTSPPTISSGQFAPFQTDVNGNLKTVVTGSVSATQSGTWNIGTVSALPALPAGSAVVGKFGIDQTTPGTTNGVQLAAAIPTGANTIGAVNAGTGFPSVSAAGTSGVNLATIQGSSSGVPVPVTGTITSNGNISGTGTAGTPATGVVSVQGVSGGTGLPVTGTVTGSGTFNFAPVADTSSYTMTAVGYTGSPAATPFVIAGESILTFTTSGTWTSGTLGVALSADNGATYKPTSNLGIRCISSTSGTNAGQSWYQTSSASPVETVQCPVSGFTNAVVYLIAASSASVTVNWSLGQNGINLTPAYATKSITSSSNTGCTALKTAPGILHGILTLAVQTAWIQFYNDNGTCAPTDIIWGYNTGSTNFPAPGTFLTIDVPFNGNLSYALGNTGSASAGSWVGNTATPAASPFTACAISCPAAQILYY